MGQQPLNLPKHKVFVRDTFFILWKETLESPWPPLQGGIFFPTELVDFKSYSRTRNLCLEYKVFSGDSQDITVHTTLGQMLGISNFLLDKLTNV